MKYGIITALLLATSVSGCAYFDESAEKPPATLQAPYTEAQQWWRAFNDPLMQRLTNDLLQQNLELQIGLSRIEEARAVQRISRSALLPDVTVNGSATRGNSSFGAVTPQSISRIGFDAAWEVDIFGANHAGFNAAQARVDEAVASAEDIRRIITADLIRAVVEWRQAQQTLIETKSLFEAQSDQVSLFQSRVDAGLMDATFLERARAQREQTATQIPIAEAAAKAAQYQAERLLGNAPESLAALFAEAEAVGLHVPEPDAALDIPIDTIRQRPDIRSAFASLMAAQAGLAQAEANLYPKLSLSAFYGVQETSEGLEPFIAPNPLWSLAGAVAAPLINFGELRGAVDAADARASQAALAYEQAVLMALQEAKTALAEYLQGVNAMNQQAAALAHRQETVALARERFESGLTDMTDLTTAQAELDQATLALIERKAAAAIAYIRLQKALGM